MLWGFGGDLNHGDHLELSVKREEKNISLL